MTTKDRRKGIRRFVDMPAEFSVQGRSYQGRIKNLNSAGFLTKQRIRFRKDRSSHRLQDFSVLPMETIEST